MTITDNRPHTAAEMAALPIGPEFGVEEHVYTDQDRQNGYITVRGKRIDIDVRLSKMQIPVARPVVVPPLGEEDDIVSYRDEDGVHWMLGRYADGAWFRKRMS